MIIRSILIFSLLYIVSCKPRNGEVVRKTILKPIRDFEVAFNADKCEKNQFYNLDSELCETCRVCNDYMYERAPCAKYENTVCGWCGSETIIRNDDFKKKCVQRVAQLNEKDKKIVVNDPENEIYESSEFDDLPKWRGQGSKKKTDPFETNLDLDSIAELFDDDRELPPQPLEDEDSDESEEANDEFVITFDTNSDEEISDMKADKKFMNIQKERIRKILKAENKEKEEEGDDVKDEEDSEVSVEDVKSAEEIVDSVREFSIVQVPILKRTKQEKETQTRELVFEIKDDDETSEEESSSEEEEEKIVENAKIRLERTADVIRILLRVILMALPAALIICCFSSCRNRRRNCKCKFAHLRIIRPDNDQEEILSRAAVHARIAHQKESFGKQQEKHVYVNPLMEA